MILSDSTSAAAIATNIVYHSKTKHFEIDLHFIIDKVTRGELKISFVTSRDQIADVLTKPLPYYKFSHFRSKLKVFDKTLSLSEGVESSSYDESKVDLELKALLASHMGHYVQQQAADDKLWIYKLKRAMKRIYNQGKKLKSKFFHQSLVHLSPMQHTSDKFILYVYVCVYDTTRDSINKNTKSPM